MSTVKPIWQKLEMPVRKWTLSTIQFTEPCGKINNSAIAVAKAIGRVAAQMDFTSSYQPGNLYATILPEGVRSTNEVFYTPSALTRRLIKC